MVAALGRAERARDKVRNNRGNEAETPATPGGGARPAVETSRLERMDPTIPRGRGGSIRNR